MPPPKRGRPLGSSPHRDSDDDILKRAARLLVFLHVKTPTEAFRRLVGDEDEAAIRRLQRRWTRNSQTYIDGVQQELRNRRWEIDAKALEENAPHIFEKISAFAKSEGGAEVLAAQLGGNDSSSLMSLGIMKLWELLQRYSPTGSDAAEQAFEDVYANWCRYGNGPDAAFLQRFAELCLDKAADTEPEGPMGQDKP